MEKYYLTATDLMNYCYCPRIIYFIHVLKKPQFTTKKEYKGREKEQEFKNKGQRTKIIKKYPRLPKLFRIHLVSERLGMKTIVDSIMIDESKKEAYPLQAKYSFTPRTLFQTQRNQLIMESLIIEEEMDYKSPFGFIKFLRSGDLIKINTEKRENLFEILKDIKKIAKTEIIPKATKFKKRCIDCCFKNICMRS